ncbi:Phosphotransferase enzyme family protein [Neofusicoccum parvum]|nr:Phosphotransferase enzyme family protein [Neofusicoccum parvum]
MEITTTSQLEDYLNSAEIDFTSVEPLSGGTGNFVWRLTLPSGETRVVKHAEPYVKANPAIPFNVDRTTFEANALSLLPQTLSSTQPTPSHPTVRLPTLHHSDPDAAILILSDCGPHNLKAAYPTLPAPSIHAIGASLGTWLAQLHHRTPALFRSRDNTTAKSIYRHAYANLATAFEKYGLDAGLARAVNDDFGVRLATDDECLCHGDFWPGNVLVRDEPARGKTLSVVDWEMTRRGTGATDVAQFAAEAWLLDRFCGGKGLVGAFLEAYVGAVGGGKGAEWVRRVVVHFGVHVAFWPTRVEWCGVEETGELVKVGREYLVAGREADWDVVKKGPLAPVLRLLE